MGIYNWDNWYLCGRKNGERKVVCHGPFNDVFKADEFYWSNKDDITDSTLLRLNPYNPFKTITLTYSYYRLFGKVSINSVKNDLQC